MKRILVAVALTASLGTPLSSAPLDFLWSALGSLGGSSHSKGRLWLGPERPQQLQPRASSRD